MAPGRQTTQLRCNAAARRTAHALDSYVEAAALSERGRQRHGAWCAAFAFALAIGAAACGSDDADGWSSGDAGGGGATSSGGTTNSGGTTSSSSGGAGTSSGGNSTSGQGSGSASAGSGGSGGSASVDEPPSCAPGGPGLSTCGPDGNESCCTSLLVTGGTFYRTYSSNGGRATNTRDPATLSSFRLDKYEMTVGRFRQYVDYLVAGGSPPAAGSGKHTHLNDGQGVADSAKRGSFESGWNSSWDRYIPTGQGAAATWTKNLTPTVYGTWTANAGDNEMLPLTFMNWYEAHAFCIWDGGFLPTEAEWKYATAGGDEQRMYPWGSMDPGSGNEYAIYDCYYPSGRRGSCTGVANVPDVGSTPLGVGRFGQWDLSGSVWEWNLDVYANYVSPCEDCANLTGATNRVLPGGGFHTGLMPYLLSSNRSAVSYDPANYRGDYGVGVRCARTP